MKICIRWLFGLVAAFNDAVLTMVPNLRKNIAYDQLKSFAPVSLMGTTPGCWWPPPACRRRTWPS